MVFISSIADGSNVDGGSIVSLLFLCLGLCVHSSPDITTYDKHGSSDKCFEGKSSTQTCASGSKLCGGRDTEANFVYRVTLPG